jgi:hypothetical protein
LDLQRTHQAMISRLQQGDVPLRSGQLPFQLMGDLTAATGREVALIRIGNQRWLRMGDGTGVRVFDADRVIAHTHPSGEFRWSVGPDSDMAVFTNPMWNLTKQQSSILVGPCGTWERLPIPR